MKRAIWLTMMVVAIGCGGSDAEDGADGSFALSGGPSDEVAAGRHDDSDDSAADQANTDVAPTPAADEAPDGPGESSSTDVTDTPDDTPTDDVDADLACQPDECGPAPEAPNILCDDGSVGGPVCGREDSGECAWSIRECPEVKECSLEDCGPAPGAPGYLCIDGSWGGPVCGRLDDGTCGYSFHQCPTECKPELCGPEPDWPILMCDDGSESGPICVTDGDPITDDGCMWKLRECP